MAGGMRKYGGRASRWGVVKGCGGEGVPGEAGCGRGFTGTTGGRVEYGERGDKPSHEPVSRRPQGWSIRRGGGVAVACPQPLATRACGAASAPCQGQETILRHSSSVHLHRGAGAQGRRANWGAS